MRLQQTTYLLILLSLPILFSQCKTQRIVSEPSAPQTVEQQIHEHPILSEHFTGFVLFDPRSDRYLIDINGDKSFTPASNTKLPTYLSARLVLGDSVPSFAYGSMGDTTVLRGTGDPYHLGGMDGDSMLCRWLSTRDGAVYYDDSHTHSDRFGSGWTWDDYQYDYQMEVSALPLYDNSMILSMENEDLFEYPDLGLWRVDMDTSISRAYHRPEFSNDVTINPNHRRWERRDAFIPLHLSAELTTEMLSRSCGVDVRLWNRADSIEYQTVYRYDLDSMYRHFLKVSDNYIAEQLIQMVSYELYGELDTDRALDSLERLIFTPEDGKSRWVDGSGLSRYNLFTPKQMIAVLRQLNDLHTTTEELAFFFPYGEENTTIDATLLTPIGAPEASPFIYAKTGTLSNNHNLSGWIVTQSGRRYLFSFMNNHYHRPKKDIIRAMREVLSQVYWKY